MKRITSAWVCGAMVLPAVVVGADLIEAVRPAGTTLELQVTGVAGVPADAAAVVLNLTSADARGTGFLTAFPCGEARPNASNLNYYQGAPVANSAIVRVGTGGKICLFTADADTELIADVNGWFPANSTYKTTSPSRLLDTRRPQSTIDGANAGQGLRRAGTIYELPVVGRAGVPANAAAVVLNLTSADALGTGFVTAYPCGAAVPNASNLNYRGGAPVANSAIVKVGTNGSVCLLTADADTQLIADINGYFPATGYTSMTPARLLDTRSPQSTVDGANAGQGLRRAGMTYELQVGGRAGVPANAAAVALNLTSAGAVGTGFVTAFPCGASRPVASNLNYGAGAPVANSAIVKVGTDGKVCLFTGDTDTHLIADVNGYFPAAAGTTAATSATTGYTSMTPVRLLDTRSVPTAAPPPPPGDAAFVETFTGNTGLDHFRIGVLHRNIGTQELGSAPVITGGNNGAHGGTWTGDHDLNCGNPDTQRPLRSVKTQDTTGANGWNPTVDFNLDEIVYNCVDHMMTSMGEVDGYSVLWFTPNKIFNSSQSKVSWDVGVTNLLARKWWEVAVIPAGGPEVTTIEWLAGTAGVPSYPANSVVLGQGPFGNTLNVHSANRDEVITGDICTIDPEGCASKAIRRTFSLQDNRNGTITARFGERSWTLPGSFPAGDFEVLFKDHSYSPDKDGVPVGHTWHWDNIVVQ